MTLKNGFGKRSLFVLSGNDLKIKTWTLRFPTKESPNMEKALFDWQSCCSMTSKQSMDLFLKKFLGMKIFHPEAFA